MGIVGLGNIGGEIARRGTGFRMNIVAVDLNPARPPLLAEVPEQVLSFWCDHIEHTVKELEARHPQP